MQDYSLDQVELGQRLAEMQEEGKPRLHSEKRIDVPSGRQADCPNGYATPCEPVRYRNFSERRNCATSSSGINVMHPSDANCAG